MVDTPKDREQAALIEARRDRARQMYEGRAIFQPNPLYAQDVFEPESYLRTRYGDPMSAEPLPSGRYPDPRIPSPLSAVRAEDIKAFRENPEKYFEDNAQQLNNEQSLLDKGKSMFARIFDYRDEADASLFGVDLSAVESTWDGFLRYMTGSYNLLSVGFGGLISAAPGGLQTLSYDELSGGKSVGEVLSGEMEPGDAPSPGQIAIASIAKEAARIRNGQARLSDVLLLNPATAPFILAGLAAEDSPLQADDFDFMDKEQREKAFSSGWEQWMSGFTDAGLMFADPLIGVGVGMKVMRLGLLGNPGSARYATDFGRFADDQIDELLPLIPGEASDSATVLRQYDEIASERAQRIATGNALQDVEAGFIPEGLPTLGGRITETTDTSKLANTYGGFIADVVRVREDGTKVMPVDEILKRPEIEANPNAGAIADLLFKTEDPVIANLIIKASAGTTGALEQLQRITPALGDMVFRVRREHFARMYADEPTKLAEVKGTLQRDIENLEQQKLLVETEQVKLLRLEKDKPPPKNSPDNVPDESLKMWSDLEDTRLNLDQSIKEAAELIEVADGKVLDTLDYTSPFYRADVADAIVDDLHRQKDVVTQALNREIAGAAAEARISFPAKNNAYSRMVMKRRESRGRSRAQYAAEGTSILPRKRPVRQEDGTIIYKSDGWFSPSEFEGVGRVRRNARVWRWMGSETPSGWLGLKGTSTVNSEREFAAALDLDVYKGDGVVVRRSVPDPDSGPGATKIEEVVVGGRQRRDELFQQFASAINNPEADPYKALLDIEDAITSDLALLYNQNPERLSQIVGRGKTLRNQHMDNIRTRGYWVDENGDKNHVPWLEVHSANGTYMQNFVEFEKILKREAKRDGGSRLTSAWDITSNTAAGAYNLFNNFWRPATLMRLSYTQRNVFEGMIRAMAYTGSLAPLTWPVRATYHGTRNKIMASKPKKQARIAQERVDASTYGAIARERDAAATEMGILERGMLFREAGDKDPVYHVLRRQEDGSYQPERYTQAEYKSALSRQKERVDELELRLKANESEFTAAVKKTEFGDWRERELKAIDAAIKSNANDLARISELLDAPDAYGRLIALSENPAMIRQLGELTEQGRYLRMKEHKIRYNPTDAIAEYQGFAGRQRRIGSGTSIGPDGNHYNDAFVGVYDQMNRKLMSSDTTIKQQLSLNFNVTESLFYRQLVKNNQPIEYTPATRQQYAEGMVDVIDDMASSSLIRHLLDNNMDVDDALRWMRFDPQGQAFYNRLRLLFGDSADNPATIADAPSDPAVFIDIPTPDGVTKQKRLVAFGEDITTSSGEKITIFDEEAALAYINDVVNKVAQGMQQQEVFIALLRRRADEIKSKGDPMAPGGISRDVSGVNSQAVLNAIDSLPPEIRDNLGYTMGDHVIQMGTDKFLDVYAKGINRLFRFLGTVPEDAVVRGPFYNLRYKATRNRLVEQYWASRGMDVGQVRQRKRTKTPEGRQEGVSIEHDEFQIPVSELSRIEVLAHRQALKDTREWMYTIERRTKLGKYGEWLFPFISATQNSTVTMGKLLYKEPWLAPFIADLWRMPTRLGIEDEEGNMKMPMPFKWVQKTLQDNPDIPFLGGVVDSADMITIPKNGLNVIAPETGFGLIPRPSAWVQVGASELMKANAFPVETPQILRNALGDETADEVYQMVKEYVFGEQSGMSAMPGSVDKVMPAWLQKLVQSRNELSRQHGYQYQLQYHTQMARWRAGERDEPPTEDEISRRTTNSFWFQFLGNMGVPTPLTPYPILTRPIVDSPVQAMQDVYQQYREADPLNASMNFDRQFGDWALEMANTKVTRNVGGASPVPEAITDIKKFDGLIRKAAPLVGDDLSVLGIITNNRASQSEYEASAYRWQTSEKIPGTNREWREVQSPEMSTAERQRVVGWTKYRQFMDQLDAKLQNAGLSSYEVAGARELKAARERFIANMMQNPEYAGWLVDYQDRGGQRTQAAVRTMELAVADDTFRDELMKSGNEQLYGIMGEYVFFRRGIINALERTGKSINHQDNIALKTAWANMRQKWKNRDVRWAEIADLYLSGDENPISPGSFIGEVAMASGVSGV